MERKAYIFLAGILAVSFCLKILLLIYLHQKDPELLLTLDAEGYIRLAKTIIETGTFSISPELLGVPETIRTPGYPLFVALGYSLFGYSNVGVILLQILISLLTIFFAFKIALSLANKSIGVITAGLMALDVLSFDFTIRIMAETLFTFIILLIFLTGIKLIKTRGNLLYALILGILTAAATQIRPINYFLFVFLILFFAVYGLVKHWKAAKTILCSVLILIPPIILIGGWQYRNYRLTGYSDFSTIANINMYFFRAAGITALQEGKTLQEIQKRFDYGTYYQKLLDNKKKMPEILHEWNEAGLAIVKQHPWLLAKMQLKGMISVIIRPGGSAITHIFGYDLNMLQKDLSNSEIADMLGKPFKISVYAALFYLFVLYAGIMSWFINLFKAKKIDSIYILLLALAAYFILISGGPEGDSRFRIPIMPLLAIISAQGWGRVAGS